MVDFTETIDGKTPNGKRVADQFVAVRQRGLLNAGMDVLAAAIREAKPGMEVRWERYSAEKESGKDDVTMREAMGWRLCDYQDLKGGDFDTPSTPKSGLIRRGDLVLMMAPVEEAAEWLRQDSEAAQTDIQSAKIAFDEALDAKKVRRSDGEVDQARGVGQIKVRSEQVQVPNTE